MEGLFVSRTGCSYGFLRLRFYRKIVGADHHNRDHGVTGGSCPATSGRQSDRRKGRGSGGCPRTTTSGRSSSRSSTPTSSSEGGSQCEGSSSFESSSGRSSSGGCKGGG